MNFCNCEFISENPPVFNKRHKLSPLIDTLYFIHTAFRQTTMIELWVRRKQTKQAT